MNYERIADCIMFTVGSIMLAAGLVGIICMVADAIAIIGVVADAIAR